MLELAGETGEGGEGTAAVELFPVGCVSAAGSALCACAWHATRRTVAPIDLVNFELFMSF